MAPVVTIVSGKGGVGKSVVSVNVAEALAGQGSAVALVDADLAQPNCALLMNEPSPRSVDENLSASLRDCWHPCGSGVTLVQGGGSNVEGVDHGVLKARLDDQLEELRDVHDLVLIDAPAGTGSTTKWALDRSDFAALLIADEPTSVADAYSLVKSVWEIDSSYRFGTVVNFAEGDAHGRDVDHRFGLITRRFTGNGAFYLGWVPFSGAIRSSVARQTPVVRKDAALASVFGSLGEALIRHASTAAIGLSVQ